MKQRAELPFGHQSSLQGCDDGLVGETGQGGTGSVELALPRGEQLKLCKPFVSQKIMGDYLRLS